VTLGTAVLIASGRMASPSGEQVCYFVLQTGVERAIFSSFVFGMCSVEITATVPDFAVPK
jgi:hypothetical protein